LIPSLSFAFSFFFFLPHFLPTVVSLLFLFVFLFFPSDKQSFDRKPRVTLPLLFPSSYVSARYITTTQISLSNKPAIIRFLFTRIMRLPLDQWLEQSVNSERGALHRHTQILRTVIQDKISSENAAKRLIDDTSSSRDTADTAYRLWNLLFHTAANLPSHITAIVNLTLAIYNTPPSPQTPNALLYSLWTNWQDIYSYYHTSRTLASPASADTLTNADRWINFTCFSASLLNQSWKLDGSTVQKGLGKEPSEFGHLRNGFR
jgi:hypothetical protein